MNIKPYSALASSPTPPSPSHHTPTPASNQWRITQLAHKIWNWGSHYLPSPPVWVPEKVKEIHSQIKKPIVINNKRFALPFTSSSFPKDPYEELRKMDEEIREFERIQRNLPVNPAPPTKEIPSDLLPNPTHAIQAAATDSELHKLTQHGTSFGVLYAMHWAIGLHEGDQNIESIFEMTRRSVSQPGTQKPSLKELIFEKHKSLTLIQKITVHFVYFVCTFHKFFEKTINAYADAILKEMRTRLGSALLMSSDGSNQPQLVSDLIEKSANFLEIYREQIRAHGKGLPIVYEDGRKILYPTLNQRKEHAVDLFLGKSLENLCNEVSSTIVEKMAPTIEYKKGGTWINPLLNKIVRYFLKNNLPDIMKSVLEKSNKQIKPHKLPFITAIMHTIIDQLSDLQTVLNDNTLEIPPGQFPGTENLPEFVGKLLEVLEYGENPTQQQIIQISKQQELGKSTSQELIKKIEEPLLKSLNILLHHITKAENTEKMFTKFFELSNIPFTESQALSQTTVDHLNEDLLELAGQVFDKIVQDAAKEEARGGMDYEKTKPYIEKQFSSRKEGIQTILTQLEQKSIALQRRLENMSAQSVSPILRDLEDLTAHLKTLSSEEKIKRKDLNILGGAEKEAVLRPLLPIFSKARQIMNLILNIQKEVQTYLDKAPYHLSCSQLMDEIQAIQIIKFKAGKLTTDLLQLPNSAPAKERVELVQKIEATNQELALSLTHIQNIYLQIEPALTENDRRELQEFQTSLKETNEKYGQFILLQQLDHDIRAFLRRDGRKNLPAIINGLLAQFPSQDRSRLEPIILQLRPPVNPAATAEVSRHMENLKTVMQEIQMRVIHDLNRAEKRIHQATPLIEEQIGKLLIEHTDQQKMANSNLNRLSLEINKEIEEMRALTESAIAEEQHHLTDQQRENMLGVLGLGVGAALLAAGAGPLTAGAFTGVATGFTNLLEQGVVVAKPLWEKGPLGELAMNGAIGAITTQIASSYLGPLGMMVPTTLGLAQAGRNIFPKAIQGGKDHALEQVMQIFRNAYDLIRNEHFYKAAEKIALAEVVKAYA